MSQALQQTLALLPQAQRPDPQLAMTDPRAYNAQLARFQEAQMAQHNAMQRYQENQRQLEAEQAEVLRTEILQESRALQERLPESKDPEFFNGLAGFMKEDYGIEPGLLANVTDHRVYVMLHDLKRLREQDAKGRDATQKLKTKGAPRRVKARTANAPKATATDALNALPHNAGADRREAAAMASLQELFS